MKTIIVHDKNVDIKISAHHAFLEITFIRSKSKDWKAIKPKGLKGIAKIC